MSLTLQNQKDLSSFCTHHSSFKLKLALSTFYNVYYSKYTDMLIAIIEHLQLITLTLFLNFPNTNYLEEQFLYKAVIYFLKLANFSYLLDFDGSNPNTKIALLIIFISAILKYLLIIYVIAVEYWNKKRNKTLYYLWRWVFKLQARILGIFTTCFAVRTIINTSTNNFHIPELSNFVIIFICSIIVFIEYTLSLILSTQFYEVLPTKRFFASKSNITQIIFLVQKMIIQILCVSFHSSSFDNLWIVSTLGLLLSIGNIYHYYTKLPFYHFKALIFQAKLLSLVISFDLSCFLHAFLKEINFEGANIGLTIILWIVLSLLSMKLSDQILKSQYMNLEKSFLKRGTPEFSIHKIIAFEEMQRDLKLPGQRNNQYYLSHLIYTSHHISMNTDKLFRANSKLTYRDSESEGSSENITQNYRFYLEELLTKYPQNSFLKLHLANLYSRNRNYYIKAIQLVSDLGKNKYSNTYLSSLFILYKIEQAIIDQNNTSNSDLNLSKYMESQILIDEFKKEMLNQLYLKVKVCENITEDVTDLGEIMDYGELIVKSRNEIERKIKTLNAVVPNHFTKPLFLCAEYHLILNYSLENFEKYYTLYIRKQQKNDKYFNQLYLNEENLYQDGNAFVILSGEKSDHRKILYCTSALEKICGNEKSILIGNSIANIFAPNLTNYYRELLAMLIDKEKFNSMTNIFEKLPIFLYNRNKYITEVDVNLQIHPFITNNLYYDMIIRPVPSAKEYMILKENGDVEITTKNIAKCLNLNKTSRTINIRELSEELFRVSEAFNIVNKNIMINGDNTAKDQLDSPGKSSVESLMFVNFNDAFELQQLFASEGKSVVLHPSIKEPNPHDFKTNYSCKVKGVQMDSSFIKLVILEKSNKDAARDAKKSTVIFKERPSQMPLTLKVSPTEENDDEQNYTIASEIFQSPEKEEGDVTTRHQTADYGLSSARNLLSPRGRKSNFFNFNAVQSPSPQKFEKKQTIGELYLRSNLSDDNKEPKHFEVQSKENIDDIIEENVSQGLSKYGKHKKQEKIFQRALATKYYPKAFTGWIVMFYSAILITFASQIILFEVSNNTMKKLIEKNGVLGNAQMRLYRMSMIYSNVISTNLQLLIGDPSGIPIAIGNIRTHLIPLINSNKKIISQIYSFDTDTKKKLFETDVRMNGTQADSYNQIIEYVTQFQAMDQIISALQGVLSISPNVNNDKGNNAVNFVLLNTVNDILVKNFQMTELFLDLMNNEKDFFQTVINLCLIITPILLLGVALMMIVIIKIQYNAEKKHLLTFIKLDEMQIAIIQKCLKVFEHNLKNEKDTDYNVSINLYNQIISKPKNEHINRKRRQHTRIIKESKIIKRYQAYVVKVILFMAILIGLLIGNFVLSKNSADTIYRKQDQLQYSNELCNAVAVNYLTYAALFTFNNSINVTQNFAFEAFENQAIGIRNLQSQLVPMFMEKDQSYNPEIKSILLENGQCGRHTESSPKTMCGLLERRSQPTSLVSAMASFEKLVGEKRRAYLDCNKVTKIATILCSQGNPEIYLPTYVHICGQAQLLAGIIDHTLTESISDAEVNRILFLAFFSVSLLCVSLLIWFHILSKLREVDNNFKKVLLTFPSNLILSSFLLKMFLKKSSKEFLNL